MYSIMYSHVHYSLMHCLFAYNMLINVSNLNVLYYLSISYILFSSLSVTCFLCLILVFLVRLHNSIHFPSLLNCHY